MTRTQTSSSRVLGWEGCFNVRDLGGLTTADGQNIRWGALVRSDILHRLTENGRRALVDHGIRTIVDLRFKDEVASDWDIYPFKDAVAETGPSYLNVPFAEWDENGPDQGRIDAYRSAATRAELNRLDLDMNSRGIVAAVAAIADAQRGGVLVHCHAGKDRTGAVVALVLAVLGVPDDQIADDYALTATYMEPLIIEWLDNSTQDLDERERLRMLAWPAREAMLETLAYLRDRHGGAEVYLRTSGLTQAHIDKLRARMLDESSANG